MRGLEAGGERKDFRGGIDFDDDKVLVGYLE